MTEPRSDAERSPGRPRDPEVDRAILAAAFEALREQGFAAMSIESVAKAAGVGKTAIYRRYPSKLELAADAVRSVLRLDEAPETGNVRDDLVNWLRPMADLHEGTMGVLGTLLAQEREHPELLDLFRERVVRPRLGELARIIAAGVERGEVRRDVDLQAFAAAVVGSAIARHVAGLPSDEAALRESIELLWRGIAAE